jgi:hypothetical protein
MMVVVAIAEFFRGANLPTMGCFFFAACSFLVRPVKRVGRMGYAGNARLQYIQYGLEAKLTASHSLDGGAWNNSSLVLHIYFTQKMPHCLTLQHL